MSESTQDWGSYPKRPLRLRDLVPPDGRSFIIDRDFVYRDANNVDWPAPAEFVTDGTSIPRVFWSVIGGPWDGLYREAAMVHDVCCCAQTTPWKPSHRMFYAALRCSGVGWVQAKLMFYAVWVGGPRWSKLNTTMPDACKATPSAKPASRIAMQWPGQLTPEAVNAVWDTVRTRQLSVAEARAVARPFINRAWISEGDALMFVEALRKSGATEEEKDLIALSAIQSQRFDEESVREVEEWMRTEDPSLEEIESNADEKRSREMLLPLVFPDVPELPRSLNDS